MERRPVPFRKTIFVCTNVREGGKTACANPGRGGDRLCAALKEEIKKRGLKSQVRVARSGCLDRCAEGPNLFVFPEGEWLSGVAEGDLSELVGRLTS